MINAQPDLGVVGEATSGKEALEQLKLTSADVMLLDLYLPDMSGLDVLRYARSHYPRTKILVLSSYPEAQFGLNVLRGGASGFIGKGTEAPELMRALRTVARGGRYVGPELAEQLVAGVCGDSNAPLHGKLSEREFQIFCKLAQGESVSQIAARLVPERQDRQHIPSAHPRQDVDEEQRRDHELRDPQRPDSLTQTSAASPRATRSPRPRHAEVARSLLLFHA